MTTSCQTPSDVAQQHTQAPLANESSSGAKVAEATADVAAVQSPDESSAKSDPANTPSCPSANLSTTSEPNFEVVRRRAQALLKWSTAPSFSVAVAQDGKLLFAEAFGFEDVEHKRQAAVRTRYAVASVTKTLTASALMMLSQRGLLSLDDPISRHLSTAKDWPIDPSIAEPTLGQLASHHAGLPGYFRFHYGRDIPGVPTTAKLYKDHAHIMWQPGSRYEYSNLGYGILGEVISAVSGQNYSEFVEHEIFNSLGLEDASIEQELLEPSAGTAKLYSGIRGPVELYTTDHIAASHWVVSSADLVRFGQLLVDRRPDSQRSSLLSQPSRTAMMTPQGSESKYGIGLSTRQIDGTLAAFHGGGMPGVTAELVLWPEYGVSMAFAANADSAGHERSELLRALRNAIDLPARVEQLCSLPDDHRALGTWHGELDTHKGIIPMEVELHKDGRVSGTLGGASFILRAGEWSEDQNRLVGEFGFSQLTELAPNGQFLRILLDFTESTALGRVSTVDFSHAMLAFPARLRKVKVKR